VVNLHQLIRLAGPDLTEVDVVAVQLGVRSTRVTEKLIQKIKTVLTAEETELLRKYCVGEITTNDEELFPKLLVSLNLEESSGIFLESEKLIDMDFEEVNGKKLYKSCKQSTNDKQARGQGRQQKSESR